MKSFIAKKNGKLSKIALEEINGLSFSALMKLLRNKDVKINGKRVKEDVLLSAGDKIEMYYKETPLVKYATVFVDDNLLIIDKKSGFTSEEVFQSVKEEYKAARFIHRLDRNTSGIMAFALSGIAEEELLKGFKNRTFDKTYKTTVLGVMPKKEDTLTAYLIKDSEKSTVKIYDEKLPGSVQIKTGYKVQSSNGQTSELTVKLYTGKTHQIRAHLAHVGHPIVGDGKYGDNAANRALGVKTQMLCAYQLTLNFDKTSPLYYLSGKSFKKPD